MDRSGRTRTVTHLALTPASFAVLFGAIIAAYLLRNLLVAGRRPFAWAVAATVMAAAIEPFVSKLSQSMKRGFALLCVLVPLLVASVLVGRAVYADLDRSTARLQRALPAAAQEIEGSDRFGDIATELNLRQRVQEVADRIDKPSSSVAGKAAGSGSAWFVCAILTIFALGWGPRFGAGALKQFRDPARRRRVARIVGSAFARSQAYIDAALVQGLLVGGGAWVLFELFSVPAPTPLAVVVGLLSLVPVVGIFVGSLPAVLLLAGLDSFGKAAALFAVVLVLQVVQVVLFRSITRRTLYIGPATVVIAYLVGSDVYGVGGAVFATALAVFGWRSSGAGRGGRVPGPAPGRGRSDGAERRSPTGARIRTEPDRARAAPRAFSRVRCRRCPRSSPSPRGSRPGCGSGRGCGLGRAW
ncbi:MAG: AI-2E family transporter [Acidimicrobiales bacterium]